ncbi:ATP-binding protein [Pseudomonas syringae pv. tomato]|uniref:ATP-binding protein n=1 Tax=Pseudomonas syringae pv. tomato TaxID=323 RepID=A0AB36KZY2_PSEUB|nr:MULTISPECIES: AAA family ATPase [Pseudomonas syringae group]MBI6845662.1 AAA family ATPase [Pseudomonas syringae]MBX6509998.1 AAA family ATPase [Pseudomonas syringae pv. tomato]OPE60705.1 ATP-binding protein [Pseudomonas syringae pv. tomato]TES57124.1 ATP-binding protein [Pseudomonas syringae pv. tomato]TES78461.1 ATP-binding protein [Pseudomonas syringae pv. tomato]
MRLDHLHLQNFRCYEDAHFDFQPGFNLVVGVNGSGKTSLLLGVAECLIPYGNAMGQGQEILSKEDVRFVIDRHEGRSRFERKFPVFIRADGDIFDLPNWRAVRLLEPWEGGVDPSSLSHLSAVLARNNAGEQIDFPVLAFYRANRRWSSARISAEFAAQQRTSRFDGYANWFDAVADLRDFESWLIARTLERLQDRLDSTPTVEREDELEWVNRAIRLAIPDAHDLRYDLRLQSLLVDMGEGNAVPFHELSDGQRSLIALIADIARRMCVLNPHIGKDVLANTGGIVIIDELDIHLHPAWQRNIAPTLKKAFPKVQFIATSHSPQVIGSLQPGEVILLKNGDSSHPRATYGLDSSTILEEVMGVPQREPEIEVLLDELFSTLENNELEKARLQLDALKKKAPDLPEFAGAEALLKRKELIGR